MAISSEKGIKLNFKKINKINSKKENNKIIIDGIRNIEEIELFMKIGEVKIILIRNTSEKRMRLLQERKRSDAPINIEEFKKSIEEGLSWGEAKEILFSLLKYFLAFL